MTDALARHLIEVINWNRTWIMALDFGNYDNTVIASESGIQKTAGAVFRLEVRIGLHGYLKGAIISVPVRQIDKAISNLMSADKPFSTRLYTFSLTFKDVNKIFKIATWGAVNLELEE